MTDKRPRRVGCSPVVYPDKPLLSDLAGMTELRVWGEAFVEDIAAYRHGDIAWKDVDPGVVVHGPPGTGKSTFARALSASAGIPLIAASYANWQRTGEGHMGNVLSAMAADFTNAFARAPCILAIDELDSLPSRALNGDKQVWWTPVVNALLEQLSGAVEREGIAVIGICNDIRKLDPALIRAGRLDRQIYVTYPNHDKVPTHGVYVVQGDGDNARWIKIGAAWLHADSKGANLILDALPLTNKVVVREFTEKDADNKGAQQ